MKHCPVCQTELVETARFCHQCGRAIDPPATGVTRPLAQRVNDLRCPSCGSNSPSDARFCIQCGRELPAVLVLDSPRRPPIVINGIEEPELWTLGSLAAIGVGTLLVFWFRLPPLLLIVPLAIAQALFLFGRRLYFAAVRNAFWLIGLLVLWRTPRLLVPGLIVLVLLTWLFRRLFAQPARR
jgi:DNA-directed RNA polymerase subunit RPC12/RpoP